MPKSATKAPRKTKTGRRVVGRSRDNGQSSRSTPTRKAQRNRATNNSSEEHLYVFRNGEPAFVQIPVDEYEELIKSSMVARAIAQIESGDDDFVDADDFALELAAERIAKARKAKGLTQKQLGKKMNLPQSQISRIERNPDHTPVRTLKRIARALGVDVNALIQ